MCSSFILSKIPLFYLASAACLQLGSQNKYCEILTPFAITYQLCKLTIRMSINIKMHINEMLNILTWY